MQLSYTCRLICLALCSAGLLQISLELIAWVIAPHLLRPNAALNARRAERYVFSLALFARLSPWLLVLGVWLPVYVRGEDNLSPERVGVVSLCGAACVLVGWLICCLRVLRAWTSTQSFCKLCREAGASRDGLPLLLHPSEQPLLAVVGVFRPRIVVSRAFLIPGRFSAAALDIAFTHESAHARQRDNMKMLVLALLPHIFVATRNRPSLEQHWRLAAEMAADEEGAMGRAERSVLLAEMLVTVARERHNQMPQGSFALLHRAEDLRVRVERLLQLRRDPQAADAKRNLQTSFACVFGLGTLTTLCVLCVKLGHHAAEILLHIG